MYNGCYVPQTQLANLPAKVRVIETDYSRCYIVCRFGSGKVRRLVVEIPLHDYIHVNVGAPVFV